MWFVFCSFFWLDISNSNARMGSMVIQISVGLPEEMTLGTILDLKQDVGVAVEEMLDRYEQYDGTSVVASTVTDV